jgi:hypothetical protein
MKWPDVPTFIPQLLLAGLAFFPAPQAQAQIADLFRITGGAFGSHVEYHRIDLAPGAEIVLADINGPGKVVYFYVTDDSYMHPAEGSGFMYPGLVLEVYWDDAQEPSIRVPLWSFFGAFGRKTVDYQSMPMQINHHCYMSYLPMPFSKRARFVLLNDGNEKYSRSVAYGIDYERDASYVNEQSRLHATWTRSNPTRDAIHQILAVSGKGQYIGNFLQVNTTYEGWWGEGDTLFQVDGQMFTHSPGTEDEYGSAWGFDHIYSYMYSGCIEMAGGENRMYRWYLDNPVRFTKSLKVQLQDQRYQNGQVPSQDDFISVAFWYQEGAHAAPALPPFSERIAPSQAHSYPHTR